MYEYLGGLQRCLSTALQTLYDRKTVNSFDDLSINVWTQSWSDTSLGFGGVGGQMIASVPTVVITDTVYANAVVFHGFRFAYKTPCTREFMEMFAKQRLPGVAEWRAKYGAKESGA